MTLDKAYTFLNFWINKSQGGFYPPDQLDALVDRAQMALYDDYYIKYATSQRVDDALAPFKSVFTFTNVAGGLVVSPADYLDLLTVYTASVDSTGRVVNRPVQIISEDQLPVRLNSQIVPVTVTDPIAFITTNWNLQLFPQVPQSGTVYYLRRPKAPFFSYTLVSGRVIVYNPGSSVQLEWGDKDVNDILIKALDYIGINLSEQDVLQWAGAKDSANILSNLKA